MGTDPFPPFAPSDFVYMTRVDSAQQLLAPITSALDGYLSDYRLLCETRDGRWHERQEVIR